MANCQTPSNASLLASLLDELLELPLVSRLRRSMIKLIDISKEIEGDLRQLLNKHRDDKDFKNFTRVTGASLGLASGAMGIGTLFAPVTGGLSLFLASGALGTGLTGVVVGAGGEIICHKLMKDFCQKATGLIARYNQYNDALQEILEAIDSKSRLISVKYGLEEHVAIAISLAFPETYTFSEETIRRILNESPSLVGVALRQAGRALHPTLDAVCKAIVGWTIFAGLFDETGKRIVGSVLIGFGFILSSIDLIRTIAQWNDVPVNFKKVEEVKDKLGKRREEAEKCLKDVEKVYKQIIDLAPPLKQLVVHLVDFLTQPLHK